jgi:tetratricopeptide (TPR) repeat protein
MAKVIVRAGKIGVVVLIPVLAAFLIVYALHVSSSAQDVVEGVLPDSSLAAESSRHAAINPDKLAETIARLRSSNKFAQIQTLCDDILAKDADPDVALIASQALAEVAIETRDEPAARDRTQAIMDSFAAHPGLTKSLCEIGDAYRRMRDLPAARASYEQIVKARRTDPYSLWAQKNLCTMFADQRKVAETEQAIAALTALYARHPEYPKALCDAADACNKAGRVDRALELYEYLVANHAAVEHIIWAQKNRCLIHIDRKEFPELDAQLLRLKTVFAKNPYIARAVHEVAEGLRWKGQPDKAVDLYLAIAREYPADPMALWAFKNACVIGIEKAHPDIDTRIAALQQGFGSDKRLAQVLCEIGDAFRKAGHFDRCVQTYQQVIERFPQDAYAMWSQKNLVTLAIEQKQTAQADDAFQRLVEKHRRHPELARAVCDIADTARTAGDPARSRMACQFVIGQFPMTPDSLWARQKLIALDIDESEKTNTTPDVPADILAAVDQLIADYPGFDNLPLAVLITGEYFYNAGQAVEMEGRQDEAPAVFYRAIPICDRLIKTCPDSPYTASAYYVTAVAYGRMGQYDKALQYMEEYVQRYPGYDLAWSAQSWIAKFLAEMKQTKEISAEDADPLIEKAYLKLISDYPDRPMRLSAIRDLGMLHYLAKRWGPAVGWLEQYIAENRSGKVPKETYYLAACYGQLGQQEAAALTYQTYLSDHPEAKDKMSAPTPIQPEGGKPQ